MRALPLPISLLLCLLRGKVFLLLETVSRHEFLPAGWTDPSASWPSVGEILRGLIESPIVFAACLSGMLRFHERFPRDRLQHLAFVREVRHPVHPVPWLSSNLGLHRFSEAYAEESGLSHQANCHEFLRAEKLFDESRRCLRQVPSAFRDSTRFSWSRCRLRVLLDLALECILSLFRTRCCSPQRAELADKTNEASASGRKRC